jgi:hypothetical protein
VVRLFDGTSWINYGVYDAIPGASGVSEPRGIAYNSGTGELYLAGFAMDLSGAQHWMVSSFNGSTWTLLDDYLPAAQSGVQMANANSLLWTGGQLYVGGHVQMADPQMGSYQVRRWNGGASWSTSSLGLMDTSGANGLLMVGGVLHSCGNIYGSVAGQRDWIVNRELNFQ